MFRKLLRDYLSLTRGERRGLQVLSLLVFLLILFRTFLPPLTHPSSPDLGQNEADFIAFRDSLRGLRAWYEGNDEAALQSHSRKAVTGELHGSIPGPILFPFDPNTAGLDELVRLGLTERTAGILVNYREAGGRFNVESDLMKIYGMKPEVYNRLKPYIRIQNRAPDPTGNTVRDTAVYHFQNKTPVFELNTADSMQLLSVYGIGPVFARRIIRYRELLGGFHDWGQLMEVYGFSDTQLEELVKCSFIDTSILRRMEMNSMGEDGFSSHPYLDHYQSEALVEFREQMGAYLYRMQALENGLLPDSVYFRIRPYLEVMR